MKRLIIMAALTVAAFGFNQANAQKVIKDAAGVVYIDVSDMPGTFSTTTLNVIRTSDQAGSSVFKKLQIAKADLSPKVNWATACGISTSYNSSAAAGQAQGSVNTGCKAYNEGGVTGWRVPAMRELQLMWIMKDVLVQAGVSAFNGTNYWASTESAANDGWCVGFSSGATSSTSKTSTSYNTRCVREAIN